MTYVTWFCTAFWAAVTALTITLFSVKPAEATESLFLSQHEDWSVEVVISDDGTMWCVGTTHDSYNNSLSLAFWHHGEVTLHFFMPSVDFGEKRPAEAQIKLESGIWELPDSVVQNSLLTSLVGGPDLWKLIKDLEENSTVQLQTMLGTDVANWSLNGSSEAIHELKVCADRIGWRRKNSI